MPEEVLTKPVSGATRLWVLAGLLAAVCFFAQLLAMHVIGAYEPKVSPTDTITYYDPVAQNLLLGKGFVRQDGTPAIYYPPGYSLLLAFVYKATGHIGMSNPLYPWVVISVQCASVALLFLMATKIFGINVGTLSGLLLATYPFFLYLGIFPWIHMPFFICFFFAFLLCLSHAWTSGRYRWFFSSGLCLGIAALIWPIVFFLPPPLLFFLWFAHSRENRSRRLIWAGLFMAGYFLATSWWIAYVRLRFGVWIPLATDAPMALLDGLVHLKSNTIAQDAIASAGALHSTASIMKFWIYELAHKPMATLGYALIKSLRAWYGTDAGWHEKGILFVQIPYLLLALFGACNFQRACKERSFPILLLLIIGYFWMATTCALSILRYMLPSMGLLQIFVAVGMLRLGKQSV